MRKRTAKTVPYPRIVVLGHAAISIFQIILGVIFGFLYQLPSIGTVFMVGGIVSFFLMMYCEDENFKARWGKEAKD